jgi:hypothetical protein
LPARLRLRFQADRRASAASLFSSGSSQASATELSAMTNVRQIPHRFAALEHGFQGHAALGE